MRWLLVLLIPFGLCAQVTTNYPVVALSASTGTAIPGGVEVTSGTSVTITWTFTGTACPAGSCTANLFTRSGGSGGIHTTTSETVANGSTGALTMTTTTLFQFSVYCTSCISNGAANGIVSSSLPFRVVVGTGSSSTTMLTSAQDGGPGVPNPYPVGKMVEVTFNDPVCGSYVPSGTVTAGCTTTTAVLNPWMDGWGYCTWTGALGTVITTQAYYQGGSQGGYNGNHWKCRFKAEVADTWSLVAMFTDAAGYQTFTSANIYTSVADPNYQGIMQVSGINSRLFQTSNGSPFTVMGSNLNCSDIGNFGCGLGNATLNTTLGSNPTPSGTSYFNNGVPFAMAAGSLIDAGVNFISLEDDHTQNFYSMNSPNLTMTMIGSGAANTNGSVTTAGGASIDGALEYIQSQDQHTAVTCESSPQNTVFNGIANLSPFTTPTTTFLWTVELQYCINRWYSLGDVFMFANEISSGSQAFQSTTALYMKQNDPYLPSGFGRMVTASISSGASTYIADQNVDINNSHHTYSTANAGSTAISLPLAVSQTLAACACTTPIFFGEYTASAFETYPANLQTRSSYWSAFFSQAAIAPYQGDTLVFSQFIGTPQLVQMAAISSYTQNFDPASTTLTVTTSGQSCGGCTVQNLALSSATNAGGYIWNNTSTTAITGMTATWTNQIASGVNNCQWIHPVDGSVISVFSSGTLGSHGYTVPTVTSGAAYQPDIVWSCNQVTTPSILTTTLPAGSLTAATTYSQTLTAVGGAGSPYTWALTKGAMPPGLTLNTGTGVISGVAITAGYWHFSITAKDSSSVATSAQSYIIPIMALPTIGNTAVDNAVLGRAEAAVTSQVVVVGGCQPIANSMTVTGLVSGLSIAANMSLSGTPTASGSMTMNPSVTDACGNTVTSPTVAVVTPVQPGASSVALVTANMQGCTQGGICSISLQSRVATGATTIALTTGSLPAGVTLTTAGTNSIFNLGGTNISGTTQTFGLTPSDTNGAGPAQTYTLPVNSPLSISTSSLPAYSSTQPYFQTFSTANGTQPNSCFLAPGSLPLPAGFFVDSATNTLYGPPLAGNTSYPLLIACYDSLHVGTTKSFTLSGSNITSSPTGGISLVGGISSQ